MAASGAGGGGSRHASSGLGTRARLSAALPLRSCPPAEVGAPSGRRPLSAAGGRAGRSRASPHLASPRPSSEALGAARGGGSCSVQGGWSVGWRGAEGRGAFVLTDLWGRGGFTAAGLVLGSQSRPVPVLFFTSFPSSKHQRSYRRALCVYRGAMGLWWWFGCEAAVAFAKLHLRTAVCEHVAPSCSFLLFAPGGGA